MAKATKTRQIPKSAITGRDVTKKYLNKHKSTTFMDTVPIRSKSAKKK